MSGGGYDVVLARLEGVRPYPSAHGISRAARAFCPCHQPPPHRAGRGRTLSVAETADSTVLVHCHAGCSASNVLSAISLTVTDLFPRWDDAQWGGPRIPGAVAAWGSAAAAADAVSEAALRAYVAPGDPDAVGAVMTTAMDFQKAARAALRAAGSRK